jgi:FkbM family methyltransferase
MTTERVETMYGLFEAWAGDLITSQLRDFSAHTRNELAMLRHFVRPGDSVLDIGAHIGTFAIPFAHFVGAEGRVVAFEANPENLTLLRTNIALNAFGDRIEAHQGVVTSRREPCVMRAGQEGNSGTCFFEPARAGEPGHAVIHLDEWLERGPGPQRFDLVKVDVEGAEMDVLRSCARHTDVHRPALYLEINLAALAVFGASAPDIDEHLRRHGYRLFRNVGDRNSTHDRFRIVECRSLADGGAFFDVLALHGSDGRCCDAERLAAATVP